MKNQQSIFPYKPRKTIKKAAPSVPLRDKGIELKTDPNSWISDGPIRNIEKGLPVLGTPIPALDPNKPTPMENFVSLLVDKPYMKEFRKMYGNLEKKYPEFNFDDPDDLTAEEKQFIYENSHEVGEQIIKATTLKVNTKDENGVVQTTTHIPMNAYLQTFGGRIPYFQSQLFDDQDEQVVKVEKKPRKPRTGIHGVQKEIPNVSASLIREIHFRSIPEKEALAFKSRSESAQKPLNLPTQSISRTMKATKIDLSADDQTVKKCIELYFPPNSRPFVPREVEKLFPLLFEKGDIEAPQSADEDEDEKKSVSKSSVDSMMLASNTPEQNKIISQVYHDANSVGQIDPETTLLNTSDQDILFTKKKAPFKRIEIARMKAFQAHWDNLKIQQNKKFEEEKRERDKQVQKAFQSREVMETYMRLLEKECIRCRSGLIGKSPFKNKSMWQVALETAPKDTSSLDVRMQFWWKFCIFAGRTSGVRSNFEMEVALALRELLMNNHPIDQTIFFDVINNVSKDALQCVGPLKLLEFMRVCLKIEQKTFQKTLEQKNVSLLIYNQTILTNMSSELVSLMHEISKMKITVPEPTELIR